MNGTLTAVPRSAPAKLDTVRWRALQARDNREDGRFVYGVTSTGVYCRPSCPSRRPQRANVVFYRTAAAAERAGLRACKRCRPASAAVASDIRFALGRCLLGTVLVARSERGLCAILLGDTCAQLRRELRQRFPQRLIESAQLRPLLREVVQTLDNPGAPLRAPLDLRGRPFQQRVWHRLRAIPAGATVSYGELARQLGAPRAARAVASACAANAFAVVVPCHRVVRSDGRSGGYRWGSARQRLLLEREARR